MMETGIYNALKLQVQKNKELKKELSELKSLMNNRAIKKKMDRKKTFSVAGQIIEVSIVESGGEKSVAFRDYLDDDFELVLKYLCDRYNKDRDDVIGACRRHELVYIRHLIAYLFRCVLKNDERQMSLKEIGKRLGGRDHSTVIFGVNRIDNELSIPKMGLKTHRIINDISVYVSECKKQLKGYEDTI